MSCRTFSNYYRAKISEYDQKNEHLQSDIDEANEKLRQKAVKIELLKQRQKELDREVHKGTFYAFNFVPIQRNFTP